jgi:hypothetical protein
MKPYKMKRNKMKGFFDMIKKRRRVIKKNKQPVQATEHARKQQKRKSYKHRGS